MQRLLKEQAAQKDAMLNKLETQKDAMQQSNAKEFEWKQKCEQMALKYKTMRQQNEGLKLKLNQAKSGKQRMEKYNLRYQQKLSVIRKLGRNIIRQIKNNKIEIDYIKSSMAMNLERIFHQIKSSLNDIQTKSNEQGIKKQLTQFKKMQDLQLESMQQSVIQTAVLLSTQNQNQNKENEIDKIKKSLDAAKGALSPKTYKFNKISLTSSLDSSIVSTKKVKKPSSFLLNQSCDTRTIRRLRNDL